MKENSNKSRLLGLLNCFCCKKTGRKKKHETVRYKKYLHVDLEDVRWNINILCFIFGSHLSDSKSFNLTDASSGWRSAQYILLGINIYLISFVIILHAFVSDTGPTNASTMGKRSL